MKEVKDESSAEIPKKRERIYYIDWLRVLAMATVFLFHCARFFNDEGWHVKNNEIGLGMTVFVIVVAQWMMPFFFVLSGVSSNFSLNFRTGGKYIVERVKRLLVPLIFLGMFLLAPPQVYLERVSHGQFTGSYFSFYFPHYFEGFYDLGGNFAWMGLHMWFLLILFLFSMITLPLFLLWKRESFKGFFSRAADFLAKPYGIFLMALPLSAMEIVGGIFHETIGKKSFGGWGLPTYLVFFILGYILATDERLMEAAKRHWIASLLVAVPLTSLWTYLFISGFRLSPEEPATAVLFFILMGVWSWCWLVAFLGLGKRYLNFNNRALKYANEAVLPFYILHQTVIVIVAYYLINWGAGVTVKYLVLSASSFFIIMATYELVVRRVKVLRFVFGMKGRG